MSAIIIALINKKGGVGKTSTCHHLAGTLARDGRRVLLMDNDPQASLTMGLFGPETTQGITRTTSVAALYDDATEAIPEALIRPTAFEGVRIVPGSDYLTDYNMLPRDHWGPSQGGMAAFLDECRDAFDIALIDCAPNLHLCSQAALVAADAAVVPLQAEDYGAMGIVPIQNAIAAVQAGPNPGCGSWATCSPCTTSGWGSTWPTSGSSASCTGQTSSQLPSRWPRTSRRRWLAGCRSPTTSRSRRPLRPPRRWPTRCWCGPQPCSTPRPIRRGGSHEGGGPVAAEVRGRHRGVARGEPPGGRPGSRRNEPVAPAPGGARYQGGARIKDALTIEIDRIAPDPGQPRKEFDEAALDELAASLKARGQLQPLPGALGRSPG